MADNDSLKATPAEVKKRTIADLTRERVGYEQRGAAAEEEGNDELAGAMARRVDEVNAQLRAWGGEASAPAKRAEKRPLSAKAETR